MTWEQIGVLVGSLAALTVVHSYLVVPRVLLEARKVWREDIATTFDPLSTQIEALAAKFDRLVEARGGFR